MSLIIFAVGFVCGLIPVVGGLVAGFVMTPVFTISLCMIYLNLVNGQQVKVGDIFNGFSLTGKATWLNILIAFFTFLWSCLFLIPGIIKAYSYSMAWYILADNPEMTAREALNRSKEMMNGHKMDLFVLNLSFIGWAFLCTITFGIAAIYAVPYINATTANFYNSLKQA